MFKFTANEAIAVVRGTRQRRRDYAAIKIAQVVETQMEKDADFGLVSGPILAALAVGLAGEGLSQYLNYKSRKSIEGEAAKQREQFAQEHKDKLKTMQPVSPTSQAIAPAPTAGGQATARRGGWNDYRKERMRLLRQWNSQFNPRIAREFVRDVRAWNKTQPVRTGSDPVFNYFRSTNPRVARDIEKQLAPMHARILANQKQGGPKPIEGISRGSERWGTKQSTAMEKKAHPIADVAMALIRPLIRAGGKAGGKVAAKLLSQATRATLKAGARGAAKGIGGQAGRLVGGAKGLAGRALQRVPIGSVGRYGSQLAQRGGRILADPKATQAYGRMMGRKLGRGAVGGVASLGAMQLFGHGLGAAENFVNPVEEYSEDELAQAMRIQELLEAGKNGGFTLPSASEKMELPGFDLTEMPMGEVQ